MIKNKKIKKNNFLEKHMKDIEKSKEKGKEKLEKVKNMTQERKKKENVAYDFQLQDNKKYHDKDFNEKQEECSEFFNPIEAWSKGYFPTQYEKEDIKEIAGKGRQKRDKVKNIIQEKRKEENINYTFQPQVNKKYNDKIKKDFDERQEEFLEKKENNKKKKQSEIAKNWTFKPQITEETDDVGKVRQMFSGNSNNSNNKTSYVDKYFVNKNNYNQQDVYYRLYADAQDRKARRKKLPSDYLYRNNTVIDNNSKYQFEKKIINKPKRWKNNSYYISHKN